MGSPPAAIDGAGPGGLVGAVLAGRYEVTGVLGQGGMGVVVEARQIAVDRKVAVKLLNPAFSINAKATQRFVREMQVTSRLEHPGTVRVYDFGEATVGGVTQLFLVMELVQGQTLGKHLAAGPLALARVLGIAVQIARALEAAHGEGIVHRDLKPDNVMLVERYGQADVVKVLDFGIARFVEGAEGEGVGRLTAEGAVVGTPAYMSPEQATGAPVGPASDLYSFGVMLFELATGVVPFAAPTTVSLMVKHVQEPPPRPSGIRAMPAALEALILRLLEKDPAARPASAREVAEALDAIEAIEPGAPPTRGRHRPARVLEPEAVVGTLGADTERGARPSTRSGAELPPVRRTKVAAWVPWIAGGVLAAGAAVALALGGGEPGPTVAPATRLDPETFDATAPTPAPLEVDATTEPSAPRGCDVAAVRDAQARVKASTTHHEDALAVAQGAAAGCPGWAVAEVTVGQALQALGRWTEAAAAYAKAATLAPRWGVARFDHALALLAAGDATAARAVLDGLLADASGWPDARLLRAQIDLAVRDFAAARADAEAAIGQSPDRAEAHFLLGESLRGQGADPDTEAGRRMREAYCRAKALGLAAAAARCP